MTLEQLRVFVAVGERQHLTAASRALNLAQSAVSVTIAGLEARSVLARAEAAERVLADLGGLRRGTLAVAASQTIAGYWLPRHLVGFRAAHPGVAIRLRVANTAQVAGAVREGAAELGFVEGAVDDPLLPSRVVAHDGLVVVAPSHPWALKLPGASAELLTEEWVLREPGSGTRAVFEAALPGLGLDPAALRVALELPTNEAVRGAVEAGLGATALSASVAAPSLEAGLLHRPALGLPETAFERAFHVLHHRERPPGRPAAALLARLGLG